MNKERRKNLSNIIDLIEAIKPKVDELHSELENIRDQLQPELENEQEAYDNMPESLQNGERGSDMQVGIDQLETAVQAIGDLVDALEGIDLNDTISQIDEARGQE